MSEYIRDKDALIDKSPDLAIKALELYNQYLVLITNHYIKMCKFEQALEELVDLDIKPFGIFSNRGVPWAMRV